MSLDRTAIHAGIDQLPMPEAKCEAMKVDSDIETVIDAINNGVKLDWSNTGQRKYSLWYWIEAKASGGFGLSLDGVYYVHTFAYVGARRRYASDEAARHAWEHFQPLFELEFFGKQ
jgi:hypothetical protein